MKFLFSADKSLEENCPCDKGEAVLLPFISFDEIFETLGTLDTTIRTH